MIGTLLGVGAEAFLLALTAAAFAGWIVTLYLWRRSLTEMRRALFWWSWWVETAVRHGIELTESDRTAARELAGDNAPTLMDQVQSVTDAPDQHIDFEIDPEEASDA